MSYKLNVNGAGKVRYYVKQKSGYVGSDTRLDSALWLLKQGKPYKGDVFEGFQVTVKAADGTEYHFHGEWLDEGEKPKRAPRKRRMKGVVCE